MTFSNSTDERTAALLRIAVGLDGPALPDRDTWSEWLWAARSERVVPLLYRLVETVPTDLGDDQRAELRQFFGTSMMRCVQLEHHLVTVSRLLEDHGITSAVLKGGATAHLDYPDPSCREVSDIDLLVSPTDLMRVVEILRPLGWLQGYPLPAGHERFTHAITLVQDRMELDLHQRIARRALGYLVPTDELLHRSIPVVIAGAEVRALDDVDRLIHAAIHSAGSEPGDRRLSTVADVLVLASRRDVDIDSLMSRVDRWRVRPLVQHAVRDAYRLAGLPLSDAWAAAMMHPTKWRHRLVARAYLGPVKRPIARELAHFRYLATGSGAPWRDRSAYIRGFLISDPIDPHRDRGAGLSARLRYVLSKLFPS